MKNKLNISWFVCLILYLILLVGISIEHWVLRPPAIDSPWLIWFFKIAPLLLFFPGMVYRRPRVFVWLSFVLLFYFISGVVSLVTFPQIVESFPGMSSLALDQNVHSRSYTVTEDDYSNIQMIYEQDYINNTNLYAWYYGIEVALWILLFISCMFFIRFSSKKNVGIANL